MDAMDRDTQIVAAYRAGATQKTLAEQFGLTKARVWQILNEAGLSRMDRKVEHKRSSFIGVLLEESVKDAIRDAAALESKSLSAFVAELLTKEMEARKCVA